MTGLSMTGIDIVEQQLRIALGERLGLVQSDISERGHALECRINAEDPQSFAPSPGTITRWEMPGGPGVRVDTHVRAHDRVPPYYDSLIGKLVTHGASRAQALARIGGQIPPRDATPLYVEPPAVRLPGA